MWFGGQFPQVPLTLAGGHRLLCNLGVLGGVWCCLEIELVRLLVELW